MRILPLAVVAAVAAAQSLPNSHALTLDGDPAARMVDGIRRHMLHAIDASVAGRMPTRERLKWALGAVDARVAFADLELDGRLRSSAVLHEDAALRVLAVRWPAFDGVHGEG